MADIHEVFVLLNVHKLAHEHGDALKNIRDAAMQRLRQMDAEHAQAAADPVYPEAKDESEVETEEEETHE